MAEFAKGVRVKVVKTKFGEIIQLGVNFEHFCENEPNESGYVNIELKKAKSGEMYAYIQEPIEKDKK